MPTRRKTALAMIAAMDDGVGKIRQTLKELLKQIPILLSLNNTFAESLN
jgi:hypothetical protein